MNVERMRVLAEALDGADDVADEDLRANMNFHSRGKLFQKGFGLKFNMRAWSQGVGIEGDCFTVGCVAGWACGLFGEGRRFLTIANGEPDEIGYAHPVMRYAMELLDMGEYDADMLFTPSTITGDDPPEVTSAQAAKAVRKAAAGDDPETWWNHIPQ